MKTALRKKIITPPQSRMRRGDMIFGLDGITQELRKVEGVSGRGKSFKVHVSKDGVVMRVENEGTKARTTQTTASRAKNINSAYLTAVSQLYMSDLVDTEQALVTIKKKPSTRAVAFYSQLSKAQK